MKYPIKIIEPGWHSRTNSYLVKSGGRKVDPVEPPIETEGPQSYPLPDATYVPPPLEIEPINELYIPPEYIGFNDSYAVVIDDKTINSDHSRNLRYQAYNWSPVTGVDPDITIYPCFNEINCGSEGSVILRDLINNGITTNELHEISALYEHEATVKKVTFIPAIDQETDYIADGGARIMEMNPEGNFTFLGDGKFSIVMRSEFGALDDSWRDEESVSEGHWEIPGRRIQETRLKTTNGKLEYSLNMMGEVFDSDADLVGNEYIAGNYRVRFDLMDSNHVRVRLEYVGEPVGDVLDTKIYIRLTPKGNKYTWVHPVYFTKIENGTEQRDYALNDRTTIYEDGVILIKLDVLSADSGGTNTPPTMQYSNYVAAINFTKSSIQSEITSRLESVKNSAQEKWAEWHSAHSHAPEYSYEPTNVSYIRIGDWDDTVYYANHTRYSRKSPSGKNWTWHELIGDGSVYYKMADEATLIEAGQPSTDFVIAEPRQTLTNWFNNDLAGYCNSRIADNLPITTVPTGEVPTSIDFISLSSYVHDDKPRSIYANFKIKTYALVAVAPGSITSSSIGLSWNTVHGNIVVTKIGDAENPNI